MSGVEKMNLPTTTDNEPQRSDILLSRVSNPDKCQKTDRRNPTDKCDAQSCDLELAALAHPCSSSSSLSNAKTVEEQEEGDGLSVPPLNYEWRSIRSYNSLYRPDTLLPFGTSLPSGRYGFMTPPVRSLGVMWQDNGDGGRHLPDSAAQTLFNAQSSVPASPTESSLSSLELEAIAAVHELQFVVKDIFVSEMLPRTSQLVFLNVTTLEGQPYCVELTCKGWRVTSLRHDCMNGDYNQLQLHTRYHETIYALMDAISTLYRGKFHHALTTRLAALVAEGINDNDGIADAAATVDISQHRRLQSHDYVTTAKKTTLLGGNRTDDVKPALSVVPSSPPTVHFSINDGVD